ncbi:MAG: hypothetical protein ACYDFT_03660 [Thermoplasmata archaeon]
MLAGEVLPRLAQWSRSLPVEGRSLEKLERVWVRLALESIESARELPGGFPRHLPYLEVVRWLTRTFRWCAHLVPAHQLRRIAVPCELVELRRWLTAVLDREGV